MNFRTTYILFGTLVALTVIFLIILGVTTFTKEETGWVLPSFHVKDSPVEESDIDTLVVERPPAKKMVFKRDATTGLWRMEEPLVLPARRVSSSEVSSLVREVMRADLDKLSDVSGTLDQWGLNPPKGTITLKQGEKTWQLFLGDTRETKGGQTSVVYVSSSERKEPMAVRLNKLPSINYTPYQFRARETVVGNVGDVQSVELNDGAAHPNVILARKRAGEWEFKQPQNWGAAAWESETTPQPDAAATITGVKALLDVLAGLRVDLKDGTVHDFVNEDGRDLERFGLTSEKVKEGDKEVTRSPLKITVERTIPGGVGKEPVPDKQTLVIGKPVEGGEKKVYAMIEDERHVFKVPGANIEALKKVLANPSTLRNRDLLALQESGIDQVKVTAPALGVDLKLTRNGSPEPPAFGGMGGGAGWELWRGGKPSTPADAQAVRPLLEALTRKRTIKDFREGDDKALGFDTPQATVSLWDSGFKKTDPGKEPEPKNEKPAVQLVFGKSEGGFVNVKRVTAEGATTLVTVPDDLLKTVTKDALAYMDRKLPSFPEDAKVTEIVLERPGETLKLEKEKDKSAWKIVAPEALKGRQANAETVNHIIDMFQAPSFRAERIVSEKGSDGPDPVAYKVTITTTGKDDKKEEWTFAFGKDAGENVRGKIGGRDLVFEVNKAFLEPLKGEFRDTSLFTFNKNNVELMKITGWSALFGQPETIELERKKAGEWVVKSTTGPKVETADKKLDPKRAEDLLTHVLRARVDKFLTGGGGPKAEKMDLAKDNALKIELTVGGEKKETHWLLLGGATTDPPGWFAESDVLPMESFVVATWDRQPPDKTTDLLARIRKEAPLVFFASDK